MASPHIFDLPVGIMYSIVDAIDEFKDRRKLLQVCREWRNLLLTKVYSSVTLDDDESLAPLARIIHMNPLIRSTFQELRIPILMHDDDNPHGHGAELLRELIKPLWVTDQDLTNRHNVEEFWFLVVIASLKNLRYLEVRHHSYFADFVIRLLQRMICNPASVYGYKPLKHLEEVNILSKTKAASFPDAQLSGFFWLPSMRVFRVAGVHEKLLEDDGPYPQGRSLLGLHPRAKSSPIKQIILKHSNCWLGIRRYIFSCANLEYFEYQHSNSVNNQEDWFDFQPGAFRAALSTQENSLRVLRLNDCGAKGGVDDGLFGNLIKFTELRELRIPVRNLLDLRRRPNGHSSSLEEILPRGLEYLCLASTDQAEFDIMNSELRSLLAMQSGRFPSFESW